MAEQGCVWLVGRRLVCGCRLSLQPIGCTLALSVTHSAAAAAVRGLWRYTCVVCLCFYCVHSVKLQLKTETDKRTNGLE